MLRTNDLTPPAQTPLTDRDTLFPNPPDQTPAPEPAAPRLRQPMAEDLDVEDSTDEERIGNGRGKKRRQESTDPSEEAHGAPAFKLRRLHAGDEIGGPVPSSSASSANSSQRTDRSAPHAWMRSPRNKLQYKQVEPCVEGGKRDVEGLLTLLFGPKDTWPAEQFFVAVLPPFICLKVWRRFSQLISSCGALRVSCELVGVSSEPLLYTSGFEKERFTDELLQIYRSEALAHSRHPEGSSEKHESSLACETALHLLGALGDRTAIKALISEGANLNFTSGSFTTLLMTASEQGDEELVRLLLEAPGIDLNRRSQSNLQTALEFAASYGHYRICAALLDAGADVSERTGFHALSEAARRGHGDICTLLLERGISPNPPDEEIYRLTSPLMHAAQAGSVACCRLLLDAGADVMQLYHGQRSVLSYAAKSGSTEVFEFLLQEEPDLLDAPDALHAAARLNHTSRIRELIERDVDVDYVIPGEQSTALLEACQSNAVDAALLLLDAGADPSLKDFGGNAFNAAVFGGSMELVQDLLPHMKLDQCGQALDIAISQGHWAIVKLLLAENTYSQAKETGQADGLRLVDKIFRHPPPGPEKAEILRLFFEDGLSLNERDRAGNDLLMLAAMYGDAASIAFLLTEEKARVGHINWLGENALDVALLELNEALHPEPPAPNQREIVGNRLACVWTLLDSCNVPTFKSPLITRTRNLPLRAWTRELLFAGYLHLKQSAFPPAPGTLWNRLQALLMASTGGRNAALQRDELNHDLIFSGLPAVAFDSLMLCLNSLPALKTALAGTAMLRSRPKLATSMLAGMLANMEKITMEDGSCWLPYSMLPESVEVPGSASTPPTTIPREALRAGAQQAISACIEYGVEVEHKNTADVIENLFDTCIMNTWPSFQRQVFSPEAAPSPGAISKEMQLAGIYAVLAQAIDAAWGAAWSAVSATDEAHAQAAHLTGTGGSPTDGNNMSSPDDMAQLWNELAADSAVVTVHPFARAIDTSNSTADFAMDMQVRERLQRAFRAELATRLDSPNSGILNLPGQPPEVAGIYADLVHRQLHMLTQFIDRPSLAGEAPVPDNDSM